jgi:Rrf2 family protein
MVLAQDKDNFLSARKIAQEQRVPYQFLRRILQELIRNKIVLSKEGGRGGFKINADPVDISIIDVIKIFQGNVELSECMFRKKICSNRPSCIFRKEIKRVERIVNKEFSKITLAKLLNKNGG